MVQQVALTTPASTPACRALWLGLLEYRRAWRLQRRLVALRGRGLIGDTLLLLEHPPVYTTGRRGTGQGLRVIAASLGAPLLQVDRGGDITFHGPGQLVAYPILDLRAAGVGVAGYVHGLEETIIRTLAEFDIPARREPGLVGVWVEPRGKAGQLEKIAAIGVRVSRPQPGPGAPRVTSHGLALNVSVDLGWFQRIVPCGISDRGVTSMRELLGHAVPVPEVARRLAGHFGSVFGLKVLWDDAGARPTAM